MWIPPSLRFFPFSIEAYALSGATLNVTSRSLGLSFGALITVPTKVAHASRTFRRIGSWTPACGSERQGGASEVDRETFGLPG